jgi:hypothetical protein
MNWSKITLFKFQQIDLINKKDIPDIDKTLFSCCAVFDYTEFELDNLSVKKVSKLTKRITKVFSSPFDTKVYNRIGKYHIDYDVSKMTFGQYIELSFFLTAPITNAHYIFASISNIPFKKNNSKDHRKKADYFLTRPVSKIMGGLSFIINNFTAFNKEYANLFGLDKEVNGDVQADVFNKRYGWIYSASQVAEYERITQEEAYNLPVRQAFNGLAYLKAKNKYETEQSKRN